MTRTRVAVGVDVGGTATKGALVDIKGSIIERLQRATDPRAGTKGILSLLDELLARADELGVEVESIGVGIAGFINSATGEVTFAPNLVYDDPQVGAAVRSRTRLPVVVDNDANAAAWGEHAFGAAREAEHVAYLTIGTGVGSGFIVDGRLVRGLTGAGAEMGHTVIDPDGPKCRCGLRGCVEQFASGQAIERMATEELARGRDSSLLSLAGSVDAITAEDVATAGARGDDLARSILRRAGVSLGLTLSNIANLFDPEVIVLGGSVVKAGEPFLEPARAELARMTGLQSRRSVRVEVTSLHGDAGIIGAAALAFHEASPATSTRGAEAERG